MDQLQSVLLPNGTSWTFQYTTDGNVDLSQITFPTGGTLSYTWASSANQTDPCAVHSYTNYRQVATRTLNADSSDSSSGLWTYQGIELAPKIVTDPAGNDAVHTFTDLATNACPYYETTTQYYKGSHSSGTLVKTVETAYSPVTQSSNMGQPSTANVLWPNNQENQISTTYDSAVYFQGDVFVISTGALVGPTNTTVPSSYGLPLTKKEYDYGTNAPGNLLRTTTTSYEALANSNYLTNNLLDLPASIVVTGSGPGSNTTYNYDENNGSPQGARGNLTSIHRWLNTSNSYLVTNNVYNSNGLLTSSTDPKTNLTTYGYSPPSCPAHSGYAGSGPTSVTNALNQTTITATI